MSSPVDTPLNQQPTAKSDSKPPLLKWMSALGLSIATAVPTASRRWATEALNSIKGIPDALIVKTAPTPAIEEKLEHKPTFDVPSPAPAPVPRF